ncbi:MAG: hypothetical protein ACPGIC_00565 [Opitutales bacterium]
MNWLDAIIVIAALLAAGGHLAGAIRSKKKTGGCACGSVDCKVPRPKLR